MICPKCNKKDTFVIDSREEKDSIRRRRQCLSCGLRFTTYERIEAINLKVIKKDGRREVFERDKILKGIIKACEKREVDAQKIENAINRIESRLTKTGLKEIPSKIIGQCVLQELKKLDPIAYIRFVSVYQEFDEPEKFEKIIDKLRK